MTVSYLPRTQWTTTLWWEPGGPPLYQTWVSKNWKLLKRINSHVMIYAIYGSGWEFCPFCDVRSSQKVSLCLAKPDIVSLDFNFIREAIPKKSHKTADFFRSSLSPPELWMMRLFFSIARNIISVSHTTKLQKNPKKSKKFFLKKWRKKIKKKFKKKSKKIQKKIKKISKKN